MKRRGSRPGRAARRRTGAVLLEVLVALLIFATAGVALVRHTIASHHAVEHARTSEREMRKASAFLEAVALWPRRELDQRLGERQQGDWRLRIDRVAPTVYEVALLDSTATRLLLRTALFRAEPTAGPAHE